MPCHVIQNVLDIKSHAKVAQSNCHISLCVFASFFPIDDSTDPFQSIKVSHKLLINMSNNISPAASLPVKSETGVMNHRNYAPLALPPSLVASHDNFEFDKLIADEGFDAFLRTIKTARMVRKKDSNAMKFCASDPPIKWSEAKPRRTHNEARGRE